MKKIRIVSLLSLLCAFFSCHAQDRAFESVSSDAFEKLIADTSVVRLDVRTAEEFEAGHIENAINIDVLAENGGYPPTQNGDIRSLFWLFSLMALQN